MSKYVFEIRKWHEAEDIADATLEMLNDIFPEETRNRVWEFVAHEVFLSARNDIKRGLVDNYLNGLKIDGWTGDITKIFEPYLDIAITKVLERGANRLGVDEPGNEDLKQAKAVVRKFQGETNLSYNHMLLYFMEGATIFMLSYLLDNGLERLAKENPTALRALITTYIPVVVEAKLKGEDDGQESDANSMA